jgi:hypothetical protein
MATKPKTEDTTKAENRVIVMLVDDNPKKPGSAAHAKFELYKGKPTVSEFREKAKKNEKLKNRLSLAYDLNKKLIKLEKGKSKG